MGDQTVPTQDIAQRPGARHDGFSVVEILSECVEFFPGAFDAGNPRKNGAFKLIEEKKRDGSPEDARRHDPADELAAFRLATLPWPGVFGVFYETERPTENRLEADLIARAREKSGGKTGQELLQSAFARLR